MTVSRKVTWAAVAVIIAFAGGFALWQRQASNKSQGYGDDKKAVLFSQPQPDGPLLKAYRQKLQTALGSDQPIMTLASLEKDKNSDGSDNSDMRLAQNAAISSPKMQAAAHDKATGEALRAEVFQVYKLPAAQSAGPTDACKTSLRCYVTEIYFYASNGSGKVVVGIDTLGATTVLDENIVDFTQPELPQELTDITKEMISGSKELKDTLHQSVDVNKLTMVNGKTALQRTRCERSEHLCVAPTLAESDEAYWIIVDLTDARIVGVTWTKWQDKVPTVPPSEQTVIDAAIMQKYCGVTTDHAADGWKLNFALTGSDGIEVKDVSFNGKPVIASAKNTDWHVSYSHQEGFGYSDAVGCPVFSTAAVVPATEPTFSELKDADGNKIGFELVQEFRSKLWPQPCNYYYQQRFQFFDDGSFRPVVVNLGRGCGDDGTYRPVTRIQPATSYTKIEQWSGDTWQTMSKETWQKDTADSPLPEDSNNVRYRLSSSSDTSNQSAVLGLELGRGQFGDGGHGDNAWIYIDQYHADRDEGASDLATLGACCNLDEKQGPDTFTNGETLAGKPLLLWYVSEQKNNGTPGEEYCWANARIIDGVYKTNTFPCPSGPKLKLLNAAAKP